MTNRLIYGIWMVREVYSGFLIERHVKTVKALSEYASVVWICGCCLGAFAFSTVLKSVLKLLGA